MTLADSVWLDIVEYRDFYDVPRTFVVRRKGVVYLFDSVFDEDSDEYSSEYQVYRLQSTPEPGSNWSNLPAQGVYLGQVSVHHVTFDESKRRRCLENALDMIR